MVLIRRFEERCDELYQLEGKIKGFLHLYIGQEAIAVGSINARQSNDHVITAYRDHGHALAVGVPAKNVMAELMGKATGISGGRGGSMHIADVTRRYWGGYGIVGAHLSLGAGLALAEKYQETDGAALCYFGEGATNIGYFHESFNLSRVWDLPVLWICENNKYGMGTSIDKASAAKTIVQKAEGYDIPGKRVDGMDIVEVYTETSAALERIRNGEGPQLLEMMTYRYEGHSIGDRTRYRSRDELNMWRDERDPIQRLQTVLLDEYSATQEELDEIQQEVLTEINEAVAFADDSPLPGFDTLFDHIYVEEAA
jgi:pyruvate dehydrogenase E1 component alpha subunit